MIVCEKTSGWDTRPPELFRGVTVGYELATANPTFSFVSTGGRSLHVSHPTSPMPPSPEDRPSYVVGDARTASPRFLYTGPRGVERRLESRSLSWSTKLGGPRYCNASTDRGLISWRVSWNRLGTQVRSGGFVARVPLYKKLVSNQLYLVVWNGRRQEAVPIALALISNEKKRKKRYK